MKIRRGDHGWVLNEGSRYYLHGMWLYSLYDNGSIFRYNRDEVLHGHARIAGLDRKLIKLKTCNRGIQHGISYERL
jgi:hypothetical protein